MEFVDYSAFTTAEGFVIVSPSTHIVNRPQLLGASQLYSYDIIVAGGRERERERERGRESDNKLLRQIPASETPIRRIP